MKRKISLFLLITFATIFASTYSISTFASDNGPSANGHGNLMTDGALRTVSFHANTRMNGTVLGSLTLHNRGQEVFIHADVNCLNIAGNTATMSGTITNSNNPELEGRTGLFRVQDNGEGNVEMPDMISRLFIAPAGSQADCHSNLNFQLDPLEGGNIQVKP